ncbi:MAG: hypothetical protein AAFU65_05350 [Pseudomonadota bacterium]
MIDIAGVTLGTPAPGGPVSRLTTVAFTALDAQPGCPGRVLTYELPHAPRAAPALVVIRPI